MQLLPAATLLCSLTVGLFVCSSCHEAKSRSVVHLKWYMQDTPLNGPKSSSIPVTGFVNLSDYPNELKRFLFGQIYVFDDRLTLEASPTSTTFGRAQGTYTFVSQEDYVLFVSFTVRIQRGRYNGSTITVLGGYPYSGVPTQMFPIVGGTGAFKLARGLLEQKLINEFGPFKASSTLSYHATVYLDND